MTAARAAQIDLSATFFYHCMTRCKRDFFLYGVDHKTGRDFSHRKRWVVSRIKKLADIFAIKVCAYAVMNDHYHLILYIDVKQPRTWTNEEVKLRWKKLFPRDAKRWEQELHFSPNKESQISFWRDRLSNISWFMRCLNENIARLSNKEDGRRGRFWRGRFKSKALVGESTLLKTMSDLDLTMNASINGSLKLSENLTVFKRIKEITKHSFANRIPSQDTGKEDRCGVC